MKWFLIAHGFVEDDIKSYRKIMKIYAAYAALYKWRLK